MKRLQSSWLPLPITTISNHLITQSQTSAQLDRLHGRDRTVVNLLSPNQVGRRLSTIENIDTVIFCNTLKISFVVNVTDTERIKTVSSDLQPAPPTGDRIPTVVSFLS